MNSISNFDLWKSPLGRSNLIEASAGTGKTYTLSGIALRLILENELDLSQILMVTYTEAACTEIKSRMRQLLHAAAQSRTSASDQFLDGSLWRSVKSREGTAMRIKRALQIFDQAPIFTIHGFCQRILTEYAFESGVLFDTTLVTELMPFHEKLMQDFLRKNLCQWTTEQILFALEKRRPKIDFELLNGQLQQAPLTDLFMILPAFSQNKIPDHERGKDFEKYLVFLTVQLFRNYHADIRQRLLQKNRRSFDMLLTDLNSALRSPARRNWLRKEIQTRYRAVLIDEFQDTDSIQYEIFGHLFDQGSTQIFYIGDPKQSIYSFRGADIFNYFKSIKKAEQRYTLDENHRSTAGLIQAVNTIFLNNRTPFILSGLSFTPTRAAHSKNEPVFVLKGETLAPCQLWFIPRPDKTGLKGTLIAKNWVLPKIAKAVAAEIAGLLNKGLKQEACIGDAPLKPYDIAILVRKNDEALLLQEALKLRNVPCVLDRSSHLFESHEAWEMERLLAAILHPADEGRVKSALLTDLWCAGLDPDALLPEMLETWWDAVGHFTDFHQIWKREGFMKMFFQILEKKKIRSRLMRFPNGERRITNILHLAEIIQRYIQVNHAEMIQVLEWIGVQRNKARTEIEEHQIRMESDDQAVRIVTIHKSKGLGYPVVFCPFLWEGKTLPNRQDVLKFHDSINDFRLTFDFGSEAFEENSLRHEEEEWAENIRMMYVALTRAKVRLYLIWGAINSADTSAPAYLFHGNFHESQKKSCEETKKKIRETNDEVLYEELIRLVRNSHETIHLSKIDFDQDESYKREPSFPLSLYPRTMQRSFSNEWKISSFSQLTRQTVTERGEQDFDEQDELALDTKEKASQPTIHDFPAGTTTGLLFHEILQNVLYGKDSGEDLETQIERRLNRFGFFPDLWKGVVLGTVQNILNYPLITQERSFNLGQLNQSRFLTEMEFYYPLKRITCSMINEFFSKENNRTEPFTASLLEPLAFDPVSGFMKGYIDFVFEHQNRYYIIDWKTNYLGPQTNEYSQASMQRAMRVHAYPLQYHLYVLALHLYLEKRLDHYNYEKNFGGIFYVFVRGLDLAHPGYGVYADRPSFSVIEALKSQIVDI